MINNTAYTILITGATGLVGSHFAEQATQRGHQVRALCRSTSDTRLLSQWGVELIEGDLTDSASLSRACSGAEVVVHCAAMVGDWGPTDAYRKINVEGTQSLLNAANASGCLKRWVHISSLGVYSGKDHYGTDETTEPNTAGIDGYTLTKVESEQLVQRTIQEGLPGVILRPGFIYGPRDRTVMPRLMERLSSGKFAYLGDNSKLMNNTFVGNLCEAIWLAIPSSDRKDTVFNIRDSRAVTKKEFIETICEAADLPRPQKVVPLHVAEKLAWLMETAARLLRKKSAPLVNQARIKFLGRNLDFDISRAREILDYQPSVDFREAMQETVASFQN